MVVLYGRRLEGAKSERAIPHASVALRLRGAGFGRVRPLAGGLHAWRRRGYPVQALHPGPQPVDEHEGPVGSEHNAGAGSSVAGGERVGASRCKPCSHPTGSERL